MASKVVADGNCFPTMAWTCEIDMREIIYQNTHIALTYVVIAMGFAEYDVFAKIGKALGYDGCAFEM